MRLKPCPAELKNCLFRLSTEESVRVPAYEPRFHVVLHQPEIPPNTGAVGRTCVAVQAKLWLVRPLGFRIDQKTLRRAGLDYWQHLDWAVVDDWPALTQSLPDPERFWFFSKHAARPFGEARLHWGDVLVFGSETAGLPDSLIDRRAHRVLRIPTSPWVRSLNLSCAVAVACYELVRQCDSPPAP
jgi:tRNA (cytidine/uridine-2'-O-)-methyltransferase